MYHQSSFSHVWTVRALIHRFFSITTCTAFYLWLGVHGYGGGRLYVLIYIILYWALVHLCILVSVGVLNQCPAGNERQLRFGRVRSYMLIFNCLGISTPNLPRCSRVNCKPRCTSEAFQLWSRQDWPVGQNWSPRIYIFATYYLCLPIELRAEWFRWELGQLRSVDAMGEGVGLLLIFHGDGERWRMKAKRKMTFSLGITK